MQAAFSWVKSSRQRATEKAHEGLILRALYPRPPPVWVHPSFLAECGAPFIQGTGLERGALTMSLAYLTLTIERFRDAGKDKTNPLWGMLGALPKTLPQTLSGVIGILKGSFIFPSVVPSVVS